MSENGIKLGQLLCDEDVITKRQLSKALQEQVKGRKGTIGEILVDMGVCTFEDITDAMHKLEPYLSGGVSNSVVNFILGNERFVKE